MTTSSGHAVQYTGDNLAEIVDLGVYVVQHPSQDAIVVFANEHALDPAGIAAPGQTVLVDADGVRVVGVAETQPLPLPEDAWFDPSKASVSEVQEYLRNLDDQDEIDRVLAAERDGKNRKTLVGRELVEEPEQAAPTPPADPALTALQDGAIDPERDPDEHDSGDTEHDPAAE